jgi:hypothetical protein
MVGVRVVRACAELQGGNSWFAFPENIILSSVRVTLSHLSCIISLRKIILIEVCIITEKEASKRNIGVNGKDRLIQGVLFKFIRM